FTSRKNIDRSPNMAKMLEKKTIYGSLVTAKIAGMESTAKMRSVNSITNKTRKSGVMYRFPFSRWKKSPFTKLGYTAKYLDANLTTRWFLGSISSSVFRLINITMPVYTKKKPNKYNIQPNWLISAAPTKIKIKRSTMAPIIPQTSTLW